MSSIHLLYEDNNNFYNNVYTPTFDMEDKESSYCISEPLTLDEGIKEIILTVNNTVSSTQHTSGEEESNYMNPEEPNYDYTQHANVDIEETDHFTEITESISSVNTQNIFEIPDPFKKEKVPTTPSDRKMADDSMRKKFKTMLEDRILEIINIKMKESYPWDKEVQFRKLPQNYLKNASIDMNKMCLNMTLEQRYKYDFEDKSTKKLAHNCQVLSKLNIRYNELEKSDSVLKLRVKDLIYQYIESSKYDMDIRRLEREEGEEYSKKFDILARGDQNTLGYVEYFLRTPGNKSKKQK
jgi:hypothetical protein